MSAAPALLWTQSVNSFLRVRWTELSHCCYPAGIVTIPEKNNAEIRALFEALGFHAHQISFDFGIPDATLRKLLKSVYATSTVSRQLQNLPDLFVLNPTMANGIFFVRLTSKLSAEETEIYKQFYPRDLLLAAVTQTGNTRRIECSWVGQNKQLSLLAALKDRFEFSASSRLVQAIEKRGWRM